MAGDGKDDPTQRTDPDIMPGPSDAVVVEEDDIIAGTDAEDEDDEATLVGPAPLPPREHKVNAPPGMWGRRPSAARQSFEPEDVLAAAAPPSDWDAHLAAVQAELALTRDRRNSALLHHEIARIQELGGSAREALVHYQEAYRLDPHFIPNVRALRSLFRQRGNWNWVVQLIEAELRVRTDLPKRIALLLEKARILEIKLHNFVAAAQAYEKVLALDPSEPLSLRRLERIRSRAGDRAEAVDAGLALAESIADDAEKSALFQELAATDPARREDLLTRSVNAAPRNLGAVRALAALYQSEERWTELVGVLDYLGEARSPSPDAARLHLRGARLLGTKLQRHDDSRASVRKAIEAAPMDLEIHLEALALLSELGLWEDLTEYAERAVHLTTTPAERARLHRDVAEIYQSRLEKHEEAIRHLEAALDIDPTDGATARTLGSLYISLKRYRETARLYVSEAAATQDGQRKAALLFKVAEIAQRYLNDPDMATARCREALAASPTYQPALDALSRLAEMRGDLAELATVLERRLAGTSDPAEAAQLMLRVGSVRAQQPGRVKDAIDAYRRALERLPDDATVARTALRAIRQLAGTISDPAEQARAASEEAAFASGERALALWLTAGELLEAQDDSERAEDCYRRALAIDAGDIGALTALGRLLRSQARSSDLIEMAREQMAARGTGDLARRRAALFDIAELALEGLGDPRTAAQALNAICQDAAREKRPADPVASRTLAQLRREAGDHAGFAEIAQYEAGLSSDPATAVTLLTLAGDALAGPLDRPDEAEEIFRQALKLAPNGTAARSLHLLLQRTGRDEKLLAALRGGTQVGSPAQRVLAHSATAHVLEHQGRYTAAAESWKAVLEIDPHSPYALKALAAFALAQDPFDDDNSGPRTDLIRLWSRRAEGVDDPRLAAALYWDLGILARLDDPAAAITYYERALAHAPRSRGILRALEELAELTERPELAVAALRGQAEFELDPALRAALLRRASWLANLANEPQQARALLREALRAAPDSIPALKDLRLLALRRKAWEEFCRTSEAEASATLDTRVAVRLLLESAGVWHEKLNDEERAIDHYRRVLSRSPLQRQAYVSLGRIFHRRDDWARLEQIIADRIASDPPPPEQAMLGFHLAEIRRDRLHDPIGAEEALLVALELEPGSRYGLWALGELGAARGGWSEATRAFERALVEEPVGPAWLRLRMRLAANYADKLDKPHEAIDHYEAVVQADRTSRQALERLGQLYARVERWQDARRVIETRLRSSGPAPLLVSLHLLQAEVAERGFRDPRGAVEACRAALRHDPSNHDAIHRLRNILYRAGDEAALTVFHESSIATMREQIAADPFDEEAHARLRELFAWSRRFDREYVTCGVGLALGHEAPTLREITERHADTRRALPRQVLTPSAWSNELCPERIRLASRRLFRELSPFLEKMVPDSLERAGVQPRERYRTGEVYEDATRLAKTTGLGAMELYVTEERPRAAVGLATVPPAIVIGAALAESRGARRFAMARAMAEVVDGHARARLLNPAALLDLMLAMVCAFEAEGAQNMGLRADTDLVKRLRKVPPRRERERMETLAREALLEGPPKDPSIWLPYLPHVANRVGITLANDVGAALNGLAGILGIPTLVQGTAIAAATDNVEAREAIAFAVSEEHFELRQSLRLAVFPDE